MGKKFRRFMRGTALTLGFSASASAVAGTGYLYYAKSQDDAASAKTAIQAKKQAEKDKTAERERRILAMLKRFKERCPDEKSSHGRNCFYEPYGLEAAAKNHVANKDCRAAGLVYTQLQGRQNEARKMADNCKENGDLDGEKQIRDALAERAEAIQKYYSELPADKK